MVHIAYVAGVPGTGGITNPIPGIDIVSKAKQSRGEKKARKIMSKLGLKPVSFGSVFSLHLHDNTAEC